MPVLTLKACRELCAKQGQRIGGGGAGGEGETFKLNEATSIGKLPFFLHKLGYEKRHIEGLLSRYSLASDLPDEYICALKKMVRRPYPSCIGYTLHRLAQDRGIQYATLNVGESSGLVFLRS